MLLPTDRPILAPRISRTSRLLSLQPLTDTTLSFSTTFVIMENAIEKKIPQTHQTQMPSPNGLYRMFYDRVRGNMSDTEIHKFLFGNKKEKNDIDGQISIKAEEYQDLKNTLSGTQRQIEILQQEIRLLQSAEAQEEEKVAVVQSQLKALQEQRQELEAMDNHTWDTIRRNLTEEAP
jgi:peptidoglycan hydrolase CwlO-like protein